VAWGRACFFLEKDMVEEFLLEIEIIQLHKHIEMMNDIGGMTR